MCINVVNLQTTKKKKNNKKTTWTWSSKQGYKAACIILHRKYVYEWSRGSYWGLDRSHNKLSSSSVHRVYDNSPPLKIKKKMEKMNFIRTPHKAFFYYSYDNLNSLGICKACRQQNSGFSRTWTGTKRWCMEKDIKITTEKKNI